MKTNIYYSGRAIKLIKKIAKSEDLNLNIEIKENAIGDTVIEVSSTAEEMRVFKDVYKMVK